MTDFAQIGIEMDSRPVVEGTKALDALGEASTRVEQKVRVSNGQMSDTAKIMQAQAEQAKAAAQANSVLGNSTSALTVGQVQLIERFKEQAAVVGMSRSQLMAYQAAQLGVTEQTKDAIAAVKAHEDALKAKKDADDAARNATNLLTDALKLLAAGYAALKIADIIKDSAMQAARFETLGIVMGVVGKTAGYTKVQMDTASEAIAAQGITMLEARNSAIKLVQAHVDLTNASKLARIAQDAAVIGNINSSEAFDRLVNGVSRGNVLILRNIGINVNLQAAYGQMAESLGKTTKELTENERVQARLNAVMDRGSDIAGTYEAAMGTASKQILSMQRYVSDLKTVFGETFNEVLTVAVMGLTSGLKDANGEISDLSKNKQLQEWGHDLAAVFVGVVNAINNVIVMTKLAAVEAAHASGKDGGPGLGYAPQNAPALQRMGANLFAAMGASTSPGSQSSQQTYEQTVSELSGQLNKFDRAYQEFYAARLEKQKKDAADRLKVDQDYAAAATAILTKAGNDASKLEAARQQVNALYQKTYVGTPTFRDTEGRESKPKVDQVANTELQDHLARIKDQEAADKAYADYAMQLADMRHKAGELGDEEYFKSQKDHLKDVYLAEQTMYTDELTALRAHHNATDEERAKNAKAIDDVLGKQAAARETYSHQDALLGEGERLRQKAIELASQDAANKYTSDLQKQIEAIDAATGRRQKSKSAVEEETVALYELSVANMKAQVSAPITADHTQADHDAAVTMLADLEKELGLHKQIADALRNQEAVAAHQKLVDQAIQDWQRAGASISQSLSNAFGAAGKAAGEMFRAYAAGQAAQLQAMKDLAYAKDKMQKDSPEQIAAINRAQSDGAQAQLKSYGDMAGAAQSFFDKGSAGYQAMGAAAKVMHAAEIALSLVKGVNAVLTQGEGDPYSAFARMAAMAAIVTGLGVAISGGGSAPSSASRQAAQGTGTILGDSNAKSDSISKSIELTAANTSTQINYLSAMESSLKSIETNIGSFASQIVQSTNIADPQISGLYTPTNIFSKLGTAIFGGKQTVSDSGFTLDPTSLGAAMSGGVSAKSYADITTSGGWFSSDKTSVQTTALSASAGQQITLIIKSLADSVKEAGSLLGVCGDDFTKQLNSFVVDIGSVSLKGLTGDEIQKQLEAVFSKLGDQMAQWVVGGLEPFEKVGEGYLQTLVRVGSDYAKVDASLQSIGKTFGAVGIASVGARENLISLSGGIDQFQSQTASFAKDFLTQGEQLAPVAKFVNDQLAALGLSGVTTREAFKQVVLGLDLTTDAGQKEYAALMGLAGAFAATHAATVDLTKTEQQISDERTSLQDKLDNLTMTAAQLHDKERATIDASNLALYDRVSALQAEKDAVQTSNALLDIQSQIYALNGDKAGAAAVLQKQHAAALLALDPALRDATQQLWDLQAAATAAADAKSTASGLMSDVDNAFTVLQNVTKTTTDAISKRITAEQALSSAVKSTLGSMTAASTDLTDRMAAQAQIKSALAIAKAGGPLPTADSLQGALSTVSKDDSSKFGSYADYLKDLYSTKNDLAQLGDMADSSLSVDQKQLDSLNAMLDTAKKQVDILKGIDTTGLSIVQALAGFQTAMLAAKANPTVSANTAISQQYQASLGRAPDAAGQAFWQQQAASGVSISDITNSIANSPEATIQGMYQTMLHRTADAAGLNFWLQQFKGGVSMADIASAIAGSGESGSTIPGFASGGDFGGGLRIVGENGPELEATGPSRIFNASQTSDLFSRLSSPSSNNDALLAEIKALNQRIDKLTQNNSAENVAQVKQQQATVDLLTRVIYGGDAIQTKAAS